MSFWSSTDNPFDDGEYFGPEKATQNNPIGVYGGSRVGLISFCCHEGRHVECSGFSEVALPPCVRVVCQCPCHERAKIARHVGLE